MAKAILVTKQNIKYIMEYAKERGMNLDYLPDNVEYNAEDGYATYVITDESRLSPGVHTFTEMTETGFYDSWKFADTFCADHFVEIERV